MLIHTFFELFLALFDLEITLNVVVWERKRIPDKKPFNLPGCSASSTHYITRPIPGRFIESIRHQFTMRSSVKSRCWKKRGGHQPANPTCGCTGPAAVRSRPLSCIAHQITSWRRKALGGFCCAKSLLTLYLTFYRLRTFAMKPSMPDSHCLAARLPRT